MVEGHAHYYRIAREERDRRKLDCYPYMQALQAHQQARAADAASTATTLQLMQALQPRPVMPAPLPPQINCVSRGSMGSVYTTCN